MPEVRYKIIFTGNLEAGKTSLITRFVDGKFESGPSTDFDEKTKIIQIDDFTVVLNLADTAGQEQFRTLTSSYFRNADCVVLVFDVADSESFEEIVNHYEESHQYVSKAKKILVGTKIDLERVVTLKEARDLASKLSLEYFETSSKTGEGVDIIFQHICNKLSSSLNEQDSAPTADSSIKPKKKCHIL
eukprot:TRINITY_DN5667_c0_g1_i1.p1 TRINITY_DN5667_c0_g1~~TRINITY_DN5667_c0_g1_i1.p1  ORF type:complete len:197 (-),score=33.59 TRINITY_DN5667_c0_g1_i1:298-861(-)